MAMDQHPAVCTVCCKRAATNRDESFRDSVIDLCHVVFACVQMVVQFVFFPVTLVIPALFAMLTHQRRLGPRANIELRDLARAKRAAVEEEKRERHRINTRLEAIHDLNREIGHWDGRPEQESEAQIAAARRERERLREENINAWAMVEQHRAEWERAERHRLEIEYPKGGPEPEFPDLPTHYRGPV